ncbi:MAG: helix-turn-helix domain-containing protein [Bacteroidia bacterium]
MEKAIHLLIMYTMLVLTVLLFHKGRKHQPSLMLAIYASVEVLTNGFNSLNMDAGIDFFNQFPFMHFIYKPLYLLWVPLFFFYFKTCHASDFRIGKKNWPHFLPFGFFLISFLAICLVNGNHYIWENLYKENSFVFNAAFAIDVIVKIQYVFYNLIMINSLWKLERIRKLNEQADTFRSVDIRWLRFIVYGYAIGSLGGIMIFISVLLKTQAVPTINILSITYYFLFFFAIFYNTISHKLENEEVKTKSRALPDSDMELLMRRIEELVVRKKMYLNPELSLQEIALVLNEKERNISNAINTIQHRNLNDYINSLRIEHACKLLIDNKEKPIFEVMYESGFNTKGAFNQVFKKIKGETPTQFRNTMG